jgi:hypothetical protein
MLNSRTTAKGREYQHGLPPTDGHIPQPVPISQITDPVLVCDFCSASNPVWSYRFNQINVVVADPDNAIVGNHNLGQLWAACAACAKLVDANDQPGLSRRAATRARRRGLPDASEQFASLHRAVLASGRPTRRPLVGPQHLAAQNAGQQQTDDNPTRRLRPEILPKVRDRLADYWRHHSAADFIAALAAGDAQAMPAHTVSASPGSAASVEISWPNTAPLNEYAALMAHHTGHAALYWIDPDFTTLAAHAAETLTSFHVAAHELPATEGLVVWSTPIHRPTSPGSSQRVPVIAAQWGPVPNGVWVTFHSPAEWIERHELTEQDLQRIRERIGWLAPINTGAGLIFDQPHTAADPDTHAMVAGLIATWLLIAQPDADISDVPAEKAIRRAYARKQRPDPVVRMVRLRARKQRQQSTPTQTTRVYGRRWWVPGFWKENQPYGPRRSLRRRTYVRGHWKGPDGAPLLLSPTVNILGERPPRSTPPDDHTSTLAD